MRTTQNLIFGNTVNTSTSSVHCHLPVAREQSVYSRFTNHDSLSNPNPATNQLNIDFDERPSEEITVIIFDINAKEVMQQSLGSSDNSNILDISGLTSGMYHICIRSNSAILYSNRINISK